MVEKIKMIKEISKKHFNCNFEMNKSRSGIQNYSVHE